MGARDSVRFAQLINNFPLKLIIPFLILAIPIFGLVDDHIVRTRAEAAYPTGQTHVETDFVVEEREITTKDDLPLLIAYGELPATVRSENNASAIGFIHYDGIPIEGALVTIIGPTATITRTTQPGPLSADPYFTVTLSAPPLNAFPDDLLKMGFSYSSQENIQAFRVVSGDQELRGYLSSTCGPTDVYDPMISTNTTWTADCGPYRIHQNTMIESIAALTINAGTTVEFDPGNALLAEGLLVTDGSYNALVTFTTLNPSPGEWGYIQINNDATLTGALVEYAGGTGLENSAAIRVDSGAATLDDVSVRYSDSDGIQVYNDSDVQMEDLLVTDNAGWGIVENSTTSNMDIFSSTVQYNGDGGIFIELTGMGKVYSNLICDNAGNGIYVYESNITTNIAGNIICRNEATQGGGIRFRDSSGIIENNLIWVNQTSSRGGGIDIFNAEPEIRNNFILYNSSTNYIGGGLYIRPIYEQPNVYNNLIVGNSASGDGGGIYAQAAEDLDIYANSILRNHSDERGGGIMADYPNYINTSIFNNTILENTAGAGQGGVQLTAPSDSLYLNNLYDNSDYSLYYGAPYDPLDILDAQQNWWGTDVDVEIQALIWDWFDDPSLSIVDYSNFLTSTSITAPVTPPQDFVAAKDAFTITLAWSPNLEADLAGYMLYLGTSEDLEIDAVLGIVPAFDLGMTTGVTITDVPVGIYHMAVTAYDVQADGIKDWREGHESWFSLTEMVIIGEGPQADFYADPLSGTLPLTVNFTDTSSGDFDSWYWDFGDGETSTEQHSTHTYTISGTYAVSLTIDGPLGSDVEVKPGYITVNEPDIVSEAEFSAAPTSGEAPLAVQFTDLSTGEIDSWYWNFGDGQSSTEQHPSHIYTDSSVYTVSLTVDGQTGSDTEIKAGYITVSEPDIVSEAEFSAAPTSGEAPLTVQFTDLSTGEVDSWYWNFGDGGTSTEQHPSHTYAESGLYTVILTVDGLTGSDTVIKPGYITVLSGNRTYLPLTIK